ncbi:MAG TPA: hypothetical protein VGA89_00605 [Patescibacteria group bacterium]|jgi:hypothetical protein
MEKTDNPNTTEKDLIYQRGMIELNYLLHTGEIDQKEYDEREAALYRIIHGK